MTHTHRRARPAAVAAALAVLTLAACGGSRPAAAGPDPAATAAPAGTPAAAPGAVATTSVDIANFAFSPAIVTVRTGAAVTWTNRDEDAHTVGLNGVAASKPLQTGDTYEHTFTRPGTYSYICTIHPTMRGVVVVTGA
jgi:plastocyanin